MNDIDIISQVMTTPSDLDVGLMKRAMDLAERSTCDLHRDGCVILSHTDNQVTTGFNKPPINSDLLCGGERCLRHSRKKAEKIPYGETLEIGCVSAIRVALYKFLKLGFRPPATVYFYGDSGAALPPPGDYRDLIHLGIKRIWIAGRQNAQNPQKPPVPDYWKKECESGWILYELLMR